MIDREQILRFVCRLCCGVFAIGILLVVLLTFAGCKTVQGVSQTATRDSVRVEYRLDSVYVWQHDSIFRDRWRAGDTVYVTLTQYKTLYKDKIVLQHDTIALTRTETVTETISVPRERSGYDKFCSWAFWVVVVILLLIGAFWVCDKIPATKPYTTIIKGLFKWL